MPKSSSVRLKDLKDLGKYFKATDNTDLRYKKELQKQLESILTKDYYNIKELIDLLGLKEKQANRAFRKLLKTNGIDRETIIRRLMGGKLY